MPHFEIDFLPIGEKGKSADAIAMRFGDFAGPPDKQWVVVVDGGTQEAGENLVAHIRKYYGTNVVDIVVLTHPDSDHAAGLEVVLEKMDVGHLLMHKPWEHSSEIVDFIDDERVTTDSLRQRLRKSLEDARDLENIANRKKIRIIEPFADVDLHLGPLHVLSPTQALYETLLPQFRNIGKPAEAGLMKAAYQAVVGVVGKVAESMGIETLADPADEETSAENNTSVVLHYQYGDPYQCVLTGDAGVLALTCAASRAEALGINLQAANCIQVPHHGSRHNVGPTILSRIVGPKQLVFAKSMNAIVSASKGDGDHPSKKVTNAFYRRGAPVTSTQQVSGYLRFDSPGTPQRPGCGPVSNLPFYDEVEED